MNYIQNRTKFNLLFLLVFLFAFLLVGCNEGDNSHSFSSSKIGLNGYTDDQRLEVNISHKQCSVGDTVSIAVICRDAGGGLLKDIDVIFSNDNGGHFSDTSVRTNDLGTAGVTFVPEKKGTNFISINTSGISKQVAIQVSLSQEEKFNCDVTVSSDIVKPNETINVTVFVYNSSNIPMKDADVSLSCQHGNITEINGKTDERGFFTTTYKASSNVGVDMITATSLGKTSNQIISVWEE